MFAETVHAITSASAQTASGEASQLQSMSPIFLIGSVFLIFYFLLIRPQQKERKKVQEMLENIKAGDKIITNGGLLATVHSIADKTVQIKLNDSTKITILRSAIRGLQTDLEESK
jgi:preprotein translocase subunit YajC